MKIWNIGEQVLASDLNANFFVPYYGDGSDGDVVISSNTTLTRDMYYHNLTVNSSINLNTANFKVYVSGTLAGTGTIHSNYNGAPRVTNYAGTYSGAGGGFVFLCVYVNNFNGTISALGENGSFGGTWSGGGAVGCNNGGQGGGNGSGGGGTCPSMTLAQLKSFIIINTNITPLLNTVKQILLLGNGYTSSYFGCGASGNVVYTTTAGSGGGGAIVSIYGTKTGSYTTSVLGGTGASAGNVYEATPL